MASPLDIGKSERSDFLVNAPRGRHGIGVTEATEEDWQAFYTATDELPSKIPGLNKVTYGRLLTPNVGGAQRDFGVCMEMTDEEARRVYGEHPAHDEWLPAL